MYNARLKSLSCFVQIDLLLSGNGKYEHHCAPVYVPNFCHNLHSVAYVHIAINEAVCGWLCVEQAQQPVPDWLEAEGEGGFGSGFSAGASNDFGGTDFRQNDVSAKHYYVF